MANTNHCAVLISSSIIDAKIGMFLLSINSNKHEEIERIKDEYYDQLINAL